ncbi:molybdenum cofactor synthesis domain-containing protein [Coccidioides immitis RS]|uniref:Molybdenum cofactor synthesis domain-containing protein n=2 Tax=Coccidioides immitis TaxID=5501 RepID=J3KGM7_COCIM|nr:molybdenum cofactor synthesis domain-containing protein [Coccidioides immitis RS]EAS34910.3 molybdenum cofactor synthesis domain-containing protein [Coccidioides immitis RS]KMU84282.1 gephyrin [Coccidioides immitis H538.4]
MAQLKLKPAILVVSDTASKDPSTDRAGAVLSQVFAAEEERWAAPVIEIVSDEKAHIERQIRKWSDPDDSDINLIVTAGGTGFAVRDETPEAVLPLIHRHAPGLVHGMLTASLEVTPFAMMARPVAGVRYRTLILTLPGSPKGAKENLEAVIKLIPHACIQAAGADSRSIHEGGVKKLEKEAKIGHEHGHCHHPLPIHGHSPQHDHTHAHTHGHGHGHNPPKPHTSNDPTAGASRRHRTSPYPMISVDEALGLIYDHTPKPEVIEMPVGPSLVGSILAEDIYASEAVPAYRASIVDGYAIIAPKSASEGTTKGQFPVASVSHAQAVSMPPPLEPGAIARITTGAPLPPNANAVVMVEDTVLISSTPDGEEEAIVEIMAEDIKPGENIREPGSDVTLGSKILQKGQLITAVGGEIGLLSSTGTQKVKIFRKPRVGVMSTGDELIEHTANVTLTGGQIRDSNRPSLISCLTAWGFPTVDLGIAHDTSDDLELRLRNALRDGIHIIITTGGVSMGELDLLKPTIERKLGGTIHFGRVTMKPGKPTTFASIPFKPSGSTPTGQSERETRLMFSLPGNPASALVTLNLFVLPSLHKYMGLASHSTAPASAVSPHSLGLGLPLVHATLTHTIRGDPKRTEYHRAIVFCSGQDGRLLATSTGTSSTGQRSSRVGSLAGANALLVLETRERNFEKGEIVKALLMSQIEGI